MIYQPASVSAEPPSVTRQRSSCRQKQTAIAKISGSRAGRKWWISSTKFGAQRNPDVLGESDFDAVQLQAFVGRLSCRATISPGSGHQAMFGMTIMPTAQILAQHARAATHPPSGCCRPRVAAALQPPCKPLGGAFRRLLSFVRRTFSTRRQPRSTALEERPPKVGRRWKVW